jgi:hypothetical protein
MTDAQHIKGSGSKIQSYQVSHDFEMYYYNNKFYAIKDETVLEATTESELAEVVKIHMRDLRRFKPIDVIKVDSNQVGKLTTRAADADDYVTFAFKDNNENGKPKHTKEPLMRYSYLGLGKEENRANFVEATQTNLAILKKIDSKLAQIESIQKEIDEAKKTYEKPVMRERIEEALGEKTE